MRVLTGRVVGRPCWRYCDGHSGQRSAVHHLHCHNSLIRVARVLLLRFLVNSVVRMYEVVMFEAPPSTATPRAALAQATWQRALSTVCFQRPEPPSSTNLVYSSSTLLFFRTHSALTRYWEHLKGSLPSSGPCRRHNPSAGWPPPTPAQPHSSAHLPALGLSYALHTLLELS
jgi:hypothetical protein